MFELYIKTCDFAKEFLFLEFLEKILIFDKFKDLKLENLDDNFFVLKISDLNNLIQISSIIFLEFRFCENLFLKILDFNLESLNNFKIDKNKIDVNFKNRNFNLKKDFNLSFYKIFNLDLDFLDKFSFLDQNLTFEIESKNLSDNKFAESFLGKFFLDNFENLRVDLKNYDLSFKVFNFNLENFSKDVVLLDLVGFNLTKRDYKLNKNSSMISSLIVLFCLEKLSLRKFENILICDCFANMGDVIIESSLYLNNFNIFYNKRYCIVLYKLFEDKYFDFLKSYKLIESKNNFKFLGIVQNNKIFKQLRENINFFASKIKISQFDISWFDVKFKSEQVDFLITQFEFFKDKDDFENFQKEFFYQAEFFVKNKICIISKQKINNFYLKKYNLNLIEKINIKKGEQDYLIYIISKN